MQPLRKGDSKWEQQSPSSSATSPSTGRWRQMCHDMAGCEGRKGFRRKVWTRTKIFSPNIGYVVATLRFVAIYALFGNLWTKKCHFWSKTMLLWQEVHYYMVYIAYFTELILQICDYAQKRRI